MLFISDRNGPVDMFEATRPTRASPFTTPAPLGYTAHRTAIGQPFGPPMRMTTINSTRDDAGGRLSSDGAHLYMNDDSVLAGGNPQMFIAMRACQ